jgi:hypothetical protein
MQSEVIGIDKFGDVVVLDHIFCYPDGFKGATGSHFRPVPKSVYKECRLQRNVVIYLLSCGSDVCKNEAEAKRMWRDMKNYGELDSFLWDESYSHMHNVIREAFGYSEEEYPVIDCTGGGRVFSKESLETMEKIVCKPSVIEAIKKAEGIEC